jgi:ribA/ribD-fused uncharacterized protein
MNLSSRADLIREIQGGWHPQYLFFWGHNPLPDGQIGKPCFSQWWPAPFKVDGVEYPTAEHFMMVAKAQLFGDDAIRAQILQAATPKAAKDLGRQVKGFDDQIWQQARFDLVVTGNRAKFRQNSDLSWFLQSTADRVLVEASPVDRIWGIGLAADHAAARCPDQWPGLNLLGFALMAVRQGLMSGQA